LVGALSSCHMLWFLALARKKGFEVASYEDDADGVLDGKRFTSVTLRPLVRWAGEPPAPDAIEALHHRAHQLCFIANSVDFPVEVEPG
jgi:organic hydroperoxide reductase OsmC/OhrA